jgi:hypothetical protein
VAIGAQDQLDGVDDRAIEVEEKRREGHNKNLQRSRNHHQRSNELDADR